MNGVIRQLAISLRLYYRNTMALIYGYLFPSIFLVAFWVLYRYDRVPLVRHMGELLTIAVLGGACFGLPTTMVSERERGVWRRYRLTPVPTGTLVVSTVAARYVILLTAGLLQVLLAMAVGMPRPQHPVQLWVAFTFVSIAFLGLGLVIAMLADNVPAVQALGQCIFLPMLIIGGVAVQLASLPPWAQHLSAFFPGRYAVQAIQASVNGPGLGGSTFELAALLLIGAAGSLAAAMMFRWDAEQRFASRAGKAWIAVALAAWVAVGVVAEKRGHVTIVAPIAPANVPPPVARPLTPAPAAGPIMPPSSPEPSAMPPTAPARPGPTTPAASAQKPPKTAEAPPPQRIASDGADPNAPIVPPSGAATWRDVQTSDFDILDFTALPPDSGVVTPFARADEQPDSDTTADLITVTEQLPDWAPGKVADPEQRVRNLLYVISVTDVLQLPTEAFLPQIVFDRLQQDFSKTDLEKLLFWTAIRPFDGDKSAVTKLHELGLQDGPVDPDEMASRVGMYSVKFLGRLTGQRPAS